MLLPQLPVLSVLLLLLLAVGRYTTAALHKGYGSRMDGRMDSRRTLEPVSRYQRTRMEPELGVRALERETRSYQGLGQYCYL